MSASTVESSAFRLNALCDVEKSFLSRLRHPALVEAEDLQLRHLLVAQLRERLRRHPRLRQVRAVHLEARERRLDVRRRVAERRRSPRAAERADVRLERLEGGWLLLVVF